MGGALQDRLGEPHLLRVIVSRHKVHAGGKRFGFLLDAFAYGPPPHGGIAFGWDRICMLLADADSLRDVIAFPKTGGGHDPLTGAPTPITAEQRSEAGIDVDPELAEVSPAGDA